MKDKVVLITGAANGIGRATALAFAREGVKVAVVDVVDSPSDETVEMIKNEGGTAMRIHCDVGSTADIKAMIEETVRTYGRLDYAFNNAGVEGVMANTVDCTEENWDRTLNINLKGVWTCMKYEIPEMLKNGGGVIVNCSSVAGLVGYATLPAYCASKHGMVGLTKAAALEFAKENIRVNAVCPGVIHTPMIDRITQGNQEAEEQFAASEPVGRMGRPEEIAEAVLWLCSEKASFVTGHAMAVDGGWVAQ